MKRTKTQIAKSSLCLLLFLGAFTVATGQVTKQQAERIRKAVPSKARVTPKKPRRVLIWNTPFMDKSPHKGYTIPQAEYAMTLLGRRTGAFEPVVGDDVAMYLPEKLKEYDAIVMNNSNGPWIHRKDNDFALAWIRQYGKGRVFYCAFGHRTEIWWNPTILRFYLDAIQFATGDLEAPTALK